jgi:hypothetical protein
MHKNALFFLLHKPFFVILRSNSMNKDDTIR